MRCMLRKFSILFYDFSYLPKEMGKNTLGKVFGNEFIFSGKEFKSILGSGIYFPLDKHVV